jgi:hypothetical protein
MCERAAANCTCGPPPPGEIPNRWWLTGNRPTIHIAPNGGKAEDGDVADVAANASELIDFGKRVCLAFREACMCMYVCIRRGRTRAVIIIEKRSTSLRVCRAINTN